jgi:DDE superfamily endonuclease
VPQRADEALERALVGKPGMGAEERQLAGVMTQRGPIEAWIIDDTSFPKQGKHSVGVHH